MELEHDFVRLVPFKVDLQPPSSSSPNTKTASEFDSIQTRWEPTGPLLFETHQLPNGKVELRMQTDAKPNGLMAQQFMPLMLGMVRKAIEQDWKRSIAMRTTLENFRDDLYPGWLSQEFRKSSSSNRDVIGLAVFVERFAALPFFDKRKLGRIIQIDEKVIANTTVSLSCWSDERLEHFFADRTRVPVWHGWSHDIDFHS